MELIELSREEYLDSVKKITDYNTLKFSKGALDFWDNYHSWTKNPPLALNIDGKNKSYLFYNVSIDKRYLTIHYLFTPKAYRHQQHAYGMLEELFNIEANSKIQRFKMFCVSSSLDFYNTLGLKYWGVNKYNQYYCDFKMPKKNIGEIFEIVANSSIDEFSETEFDKIYEKLEENGKMFNIKEKEIYENLLKSLGDRYVFDKLLKRSQNSKSSL